MENEGAFLDIIHILRGFRFYKPTTALQQQFPIDYHDVKYT
jgi:hypothetical protein